MTREAASPLLEPELSAALAAGRAFSSRPALHPFFSGSPGRRSRAPVLAFRERAWAPLAPELRLEPAPEPELGVPAAAESTAPITCPTFTTSPVFTLYSTLPAAGALKT